MAANYYRPARRRSGNHRFIVTVARPRHGRAFSLCHQNRHDQITAHIHGRPTHVEPAIDAEEQSDAFGRNTDQASDHRDHRQ
jgi:hypothetical protein